jgi:RNA:NAD 2'-phosphotransferase (TPT1/KptA family)
MESRKHVQFTKKAPGTKWMKKLIQLCGLSFPVHESKVEGACSAVKKNVSVIQAREMDESAIHHFSILLRHRPQPSPKESSVNWRQLHKL